jgi:ABC-type sugar transport system permease subunit
MGVRVAVEAGLVLHGCFPVRFASHRVNPSSRRSAVARAGRHRTQEVLLPWLFLSPAVLLLLFIVVVPTAGTLGLSFFKWDGLGPAFFVGFRNFAQLAVDPVFYQALSNNLRWLAYFCTIPVAVGLLNAFLISRVGRLQIV